MNLTKQEQSPTSAPTSSSLQPQQFDLASFLTVWLITTEIIQPNPEGHRNKREISKKQKLQGSSRIFTNTPENRDW